jgi:MFS family permease
MEALLAFAAALLALRLAGDLLGRWRTRRAPQLAAWSASLLAYAAASGALAWGAAAGWDDRSFRVYYLCGGLLTAPLLGVGSLLLSGRRWAAPLGFLYTGLAVPLTAPLTGTSIPEAQEHLDFWPARLVAILGNSLGTLAVVVIALSTIRRRPVGNGLILAGVAVAAAGSAIAGLGAAPTAVFIAAAAVLLYAGFLFSSGERVSLSPSRRRADRTARRAASRPSAG